MKTFPAFVLGVIGLGAFTPPGVARAAEAGGAIEQLLATQTESSKVFTPPGARQVVWREKRGRQWTMVVNGVAGKAYGNIGVPVFSPDGSQMAYTVQPGAEPAARGKSETRVVHQGGESTAFAQVGALEFTGDGQHVAYLAAAEGDRFQPVIDGRALEPTAGASGNAGLKVNRDGSRWAYWGDDGIVVDGRQRPHPKPHSGGDAAPHFSPNGKRLAYRAAQGTKTILVVDDQESPPYDSASEPAFSPDSRHIAYFAAKNGRVFPLVDGVEGPPQFKILGTAIVFSPDSGRFAYFGLPQNIPYYWVAKGTDPKRVSGLFLLGGKLDDVGEALKGSPLDILSARTENVAGPVWSADGTHWAYTRPENTGTVVVADGHASIAYDATAGLLIDREGRPIYAARQAKVWTAMRGDQPIGHPMDEWMATVLSPDGRQAAWVGRRGSKQFVATAAGEGKAYDAIFKEAVGFNADGTAVNYIAKEGDRFLRVTQPVRE